MSPQLENREYPRVPVQWPMVFYTSDFFSHGTVVDVSALAWRLRGSMPVRAGMQLGIRVWTHGSSRIEIEEATVLWARGQEFAVEIDRVRPEDEPAMLQLQEQTIGLSPLGQRAKHEDQREVVAVVPAEGGPYEATL